VCLGRREIREFDAVSLTNLPSTNITVGQSLATKGHNASEVDRTHQAWSKADPGSDGALERTLQQLAARGETVVIPTNFCFAATNIRKAGGLRWARF
jgi:hypothetical protein